MNCKIYKVKNKDYCYNNIGNYDKRDEECAYMSMFSSAEYSKDNKIAQQTIILFYKKLQQSKADKQYLVYDAHISYLRNLIPIWQALEKKDYITACHELECLLYYEPVFQNRIKQNLLWLLDQYFKGENNEKNIREDKRK